MDRITGLNYVANLFGAGKNGFRNGDLVNAIKPTFVNAEWFNDTQEELLNIIEGAGVVPAAGTRTQVRQALKRMFGGNVTTVNAANSPFVLTADHAGLVLMDAAAGNISATLVAANLLASLRFTFVRVDSSNNSATVNRAGVDTINAGSSFALTSLYEYRSVVTAGATAWHTVASSVVPGAVGIGCVIDCFDASTPAGYLVCPTSLTLISRTTYALLFSKVGTIFSAGDGVTTFGMPWYPADYASVQANGNMGTNTVGQVISHTHSGAVVNEAGFTGGGTVFWYADNTGRPTGSTGGSANLPAGVRAKKIVRYI